MSCFTTSDQNYNSFFLVQVNPINLAVLRFMSKVSQFAVFRFVLDFFLIVHTCGCFELSGQRWTFKTKPESEIDSDEKCHTESLKVEQKKFGISSIFLPAVPSSDAPSD